MTLKMGSMSTKPNLLFGLSESHMQISLVQMHPFVQEIFHFKKYSFCDLKKGVMVTKPNQPLVCLKNIFARLGG